MTTTCAVVNVTHDMRIRTAAAAAAMDPATATGQLWLQCHSRSYI